MGGNYAVERIARDYPYLTPAIIRARLRASTYVNIERGYLYYSMPKAACTSLKWLIHSLEDLPPIGPVVDGVRGVTRDMVIHARKQFKLPSLPDLDNATQERVLESPDFLRFTVVRNPYSRLVSAWFEKVSLCQPGYEFVYWRILGHSPDGTRQITLPEFIRYISKHDLTRCDHHWRLQVEHGFFRTINFNLVGRVEQLGDATAEFARRAGFPPDTRVRAQNVSNSGRVALTEDLADQIFDLYQRDFVELSYPKDAWQKKPRASSADREPSRDERMLEEIRERNIVAGTL
jgi:hypothetical protein